MVFGTKTRVFLWNQPEQLINVQNGIMNRLKRRVEIQLVDSVDRSDVSIAFVPIVSRAGTDIEAALQTIPTSPQQSLALIVIHHTFDRDYIAPVSNWFVKREGVFAVDFLGHEDCGLLTCLANDKALKSLADYLAPEAPDTPLLPNTPRFPRVYRIFFAVLALVILCIVLLEHFLDQPSQGNNHTLPTTTMKMPNLTQPITTPVTTQ